MLPSVYVYLDYRQFLSDTFDALKKGERSFSYRSFAKLAGSSSPNLLQLITARKLNLSSAQLSSLAQSLKLKRKEEKYFETILAFDHAKTHVEKDKYFQRILLTREYKSIKTIEKKHYDYLSHWYNPVIRELVSSSEYQDDPAWIAERIVPTVSLVKVKKGLKLLESLKLIKRNNDDSGWMLTDSTISTPSQVISMAVVKYHQDIIALARESIERFGPGDRDIRSVTLGVTESSARELKKRMEAFWKEILAFADNQEDKDRVMQVNLQMFPLSIKKRKKK
jgi:uncharacterized protein (TIGR02147 family)